MRSLIRSIGMAAAVCALLAMQQGLSWADAKETAGAQKIAATVNGMPIYDAALKAEMARLANKGWTTGMAGNSKQAVERRKSTALEALITAELLRQASHNEPPPKDVDETVEQRIKEMKQKYPSEEDFAKSLQRSKKTLDAVRAEVRDEILLREYLTKKKVWGVEVPDAAIEKFYNDNKNSFPVPEQVKARHILVAIEGSSEEQVESARKKAMELRERAIKQKDFAAVAREFPTAPDGGDLGYISRGAMSPEFDKAAFSLKIGEISDPVRTKHGFHLIEILDRKPASVKSFQEVKDFIARYLRRQADDGRLKAHVAELKSRAKIEIAPD